MYDLIITCTVLGKPSFFFLVLPIHCVLSQVDLKAELRNILFASFLLHNLHFQN